MSVTKSEFGVTKDGQTVTMYRLENAAGAYITVLDYGATLQSVVVPDRKGRLTDVVLGYDDAAGYENGTRSFGAVIGRNANRIAGGTFEIGGVRYQLEKNEKGNNLHSGSDRYNKRMWEAREIDEEENSVTFALHSADGDQGFPGNFDVSVRYELSEENEVILHYTGVCDEDTLVNMTNHSYFNLKGHDAGDVLDILLSIDADYYTPVADNASIPTGEIAPVQGTPMDFAERKPIGRDIDADFEQLRFTGGYDHNYVLWDCGAGIARTAACAYSEATGITMEVITDTPGVQLYTANFLDGEHGKGGAVYDKRSGLCLETQYFPDSINHENFASPLLKKGQTYNTVTIYKFGCE